MQLLTPRLILRRWKDGDFAPFAAMNADALVMRHFPAPMSAEETRGTIENYEVHFEAHGFGTWAVELRDTGALIGACGCKYISWPHSLPSNVEIGWRFAASAWGQGLATEAARAALDDAFARCGLGCVMSFTVQANAPSWRVMERLGMARRADLDFDHPLVPDGHALKRHIVYLVRKDEGGA
jgi:RimJ/RimL family protein N-acetyltransferase